MYPLFEISPDLMIEGKSLKNMIENFNGEEIKRLDV
jgi:hypothetical protein